LGGAVTDDGKGLMNNRRVFARQVGSWWGDSSTMAAQDTDNVAVWIVYAGDIRLNFLRFLQREICVNIITIIWAKMTKKVKNRRNHLL
jgi:hypothetical protein